MISLKDRFVNQSRPRNKLRCISRMRNETCEILFPFLFLFLKRKYRHFNGEGRIINPRIGDFFSTATCFPRYRDEEGRPVKVIINPNRKSLSITRLSSRKKSLRRSFLFALSITFRVIFPSDISNTWYLSINRALIVIFQLLFSSRIRKEACPQRLISLD